MRLIGMLDSPYVRRVAVSLKVLGLPFTHEPVSVFRHFDQFTAINPVVKAPTLVTHEGTVLMDSTLILNHVERIVGRSLMPAETPAYTRALRQIGLALAASDKSVAIVYERNQRPEEKRYQPWMDRVGGQMLAALRELEREVSDDWFAGDKVMQPEITTAIGWRFIQHMLPELVPADDFPQLVALSARAEKRPAFRETDYS
jgi:glutathione S-transferase